MNNKLIIVMIIGKNLSPIMINNIDLTTRVIIRHIPTRITL